MIIKLYIILVHLKFSGLYLVNGRFKQNFGYQLLKSISIKKLKKSVRWPSLRLVGFTWNGPIMLFL
jgi:hypothetical protein